MNFSQKAEMREQTCERRFRRAESIERVGTRGAIVEEPFSWPVEVRIQWREPKFDLAELAKLRWIEGLTYAEIGRRLGKTKNAMVLQCNVIRGKNFEVGLTAAELRKVRRVAR